MEKEAIVNQVSTEVKKEKKKPWSFNGKTKAVVKGTLGTGLIAAVGLIISHVDTRIDDTNTKVNQNIALMKEYVDARYDHVKSDLETVKEQVKDGQGEIKLMIKKLDDRIYKWTIRHK